jgi:competence protein ComEC
MVRTWQIAVLLFCWIVTTPAAQAQRGLDIYFVDTEGGAATLIVTPAGESVLIDTGNPGTRDATRIATVAKEVAHLKAIDHLITTHWHLDHYGGVEELSKQMPIRHFHDRGIPEKTLDDPQNFPRLIAAYQRASKGKSKTLKAGDTVPLKSQAGGPALKLTCLVASGKTVPDRPNAPENPLAKEHRPQPNDPSDNAQSLGVVLEYGGFRFLDLGDLTWNIEYKLIAPTDKIGLIDVYQVTHHGLEVSNNPTLIQTVQPRVAIFNNGPRKGGHGDVLKTLRQVPGLEAIYQMHRNVSLSAEENAPAEFIANQEEKCTGETIKLSVAPDAKSYTVTVGSKGTPRRYQTRSRN